MAGDEKGASGQKLWISSRRRWSVANVAPSEKKRLNVGERSRGRPKFWLLPLCCYLRAVARRHACVVTVRHMTLVLLCVGSWSQIKISLVMKVMKYFALLTHSTIRRQSRVEQLCRAILSLFEFLRLPCTRCRFVVQANVNSFTRKGFNHIDSAVMWQQYKEECVLSILKSPSVLSYRGGLRWGAHAQITSQWKVQSPSTLHVNLVGPWGNLCSFTYQMWEEKLTQGDIIFS